MMESEIARLTIETSFQGSITVKLIEIQTNNNLSYIINCDSNLYCSEDQSQRLTVGRGYIDHLLSELETARIPATPKWEMGCDGTSYELVLTRGFNAVIYRWWCEASKGYEPVVKFANELLKLAQCNERVSIDG